MSTLYDAWLERGAQASDRTTADCPACSNTFPSCDLEENGYCEQCEKRRVLECQLDDAKTEQEECEECGDLEERMETAQKVADIEAQLKRL